MPRYLITYKSGALRDVYDAARGTWLQAPDNREEKAEIPAPTEERARWIAKEQFDAAEIVDIQVLD